MTAPEEMSVAQHTHSTCFLDFSLVFGQTSERLLKNIIVKELHGEKYVYWAQKTGIREF